MNPYYIVSLNSACRAAHLFTTRPGGRVPELHSSLVLRLTGEPVSAVLLRWLRRKPQQLPVAGGLPKKLRSRLPTPSSSPTTATVVRHGTSATPRTTNTFQHRYLLLFFKCYEWYAGSWAVKQSVHPFCMLLKEPYKMTFAKCYTSWNKINYLTVVYGLCFK